MFSVEKVARVTGVTKATVLRAAKGYKLAYTTMEGSYSVPPRMWPSGEWGPCSRPTLS